MERNLSESELGLQVRGSSTTSAHAVVLRAALRGFTRITEKLEPPKVLPMLDECIDFIGNIGRHNGGELYGADAESVTVGFGLRKAKLNGSAEAAVLVARQLLDGFEQISDRWRENTHSPVALSIGIHEGEVLAASLGMNSTLTLVGDTVNVAARLAQRARAGEVILSASVRQALHDKLPGITIKPLGGMSFAARSQRIDIYCIPRPERLDLGELRHEAKHH